MKKSAKKPPKNGAGNDASYEELLADVLRNPWRMVNVGELRVLSKIGEKGMTRLRTLASADPKTDPWRGGNDLTQPQKFIEWYWGKRLELEDTYVVGAGGRLTKIRQ